MPIMYRELARGDDLFVSGCSLLVNTVNCVGIMGKGVALQFAQHYPECVPPYQALCRSHELRPGGVFTFSYAVRSTAEQPTIVYLATKDHWRPPSQIQWIAEGLAFIGRGAHLWTQLDSGGGGIAFPKPGCGNGGLAWDDVGPLMRQHLGHLPMPVVIYIARGDREY